MMMLSGFLLSVLFFWKSRLQSLVPHDSSLLNIGSRSSYKRNLLPLAILKPQLCRSLYTRWTCTAQHNTLRALHLLLYLVQAIFRRFISI